MTSPISITGPGSVYRGHWGGGQRSGASAHGSTRFPAGRLDRGNVSGLKVEELAKVMEAYSPKVKRIHASAIQRWAHSSFPGGRVCPLLQHCCRGQPAVIAGLVCSQ